MTQSRWSTDSSMIFSCCTVQHTPGEKNRTEVELKNEKERKQESKVNPLNNANKTSGSVQFRVIILFPKVI